MDLESAMRALHGRRISPKCGAERLQDTSFQRTLPTLTDTFFTLTCRVTVSPLALPHQALYLQPPHCSSTPTHAHGRRISPKCGAERLEDTSFQRTLPTLTDTFFTLIRIHSRSINDHPHAPPAIHPKSHSPIAPTCRFSLSPRTELRFHAT